MLYCLDFPGYYYVWIQHILKWNKKHLLIFLHIWMYGNTQAGTQKKKLNWDQEHRVTGEAQTLALYDKN